MQKAYVTSKKSFSKFVPGLTNKPKKYQSKPTSNTHTFAWDWSDTVFNISPNGAHVLPHPVIFCLFRTFIICLSYKCYGNISKKASMTFISKCSSLTSCFILWIFPIIDSVIVSPEMKFISGFSYILFSTTLTCEKINQTLIITVEIYLKTFACCSARKCVSFFNI